MVLNDSQRFVCRTKARNVDQSWIHHNKITSICYKKWRILPTATTFVNDFTKKHLDTDHNANDVTIRRILSKSRRPNCSTYVHEQQRLL